MKIKVRNKLLILSSITSIFVAFSYFLWKNSSPTWYGYAVGEDRRIYMVNLNTGELEWVSREIEQVREPIEIEINREESILYIANGPIVVGQRNQTPLKTPLFAVRLNDAADIVFEVPLNSQAAAGDVIMNMSAGSFGVRLGPLGKFLYVVFFGDPEVPTAILDPLNGEIFGSLRGFVQKTREFSPDGKFAANIFPGGERVRDSGMVEYRGLVTVLNLEAGENPPPVYLDNNRGLRPPWGSPDDHFTYLRQQPRQNINRIEVYDRESGELLAMNDETTGGFNQRHFTRIPDSNNVVVSVGGGFQVYNGLTAELVKRISVADTLLTEVVVTDKSLIR